MRKGRSQKEIEKTLYSLSPLHTSSGAHDQVQSEKRVWNSLSHFIQETENKTMSNQNEETTLYSNEKSHNKTSRSKWLIPFSLFTLLVITLAGSSLYFGRRSTTNNTLSLQQKTSQTPIIQNTLSNDGSFNAAKLQELYGIERSDLYTLFDQRLSNQQFEEIIKKADVSKVSYKKYRSTLNTNKQATEERWSSGQFSKMLLKENNSLKQVSLQTPSYDIFYSKENIAPAYKHEYVEGKYIENTKKEDLEINILKQIINTNKDVASGKEPSWMKFNLKNTQNNEEKTTFLFEQKSPAEAVKFFHQVFTIDLYNDNRVEISQIEHFDKNGLVTVRDTLVESKVYEFNESFFNANEVTQNLPVTKYVKCDQKTKLKDRIAEIQGNKNSNNNTYCEV